jgi:serine/threonine protein kinase
MKINKIYTIRIAMLLVSLSFLQGCDYISTTHLGSDRGILKGTTQKSNKENKEEDNEDKTLNTKLKKITINNVKYVYDEDELIGDGTYGEVYKSHKEEEQNNPNKTFYALKFLFDPNDKEDEVLQEIMNKTYGKGHPNIVKYYGCAVVDKWEINKMVQVKCLALEWLEPREWKALLFNDIGKVSGRAEKYNKTVEFLEGIELLKEFTRKHDSDTLSNMFAKGNQIKLIDFGTLAGNLKSKKLTAVDKS